MGVTVSVRSYTHSVTYVSDNILKSLKDIIRLSGLSPSKLVGQWESTDYAVKTWIASGHLKRIVLEVFDSRNNGLITRWDVEISYTYSSGDGDFWTDTEALRFAILKAGVWPANADYRLIVDLASGAPHVPGWGDTSFRSTAGMVEQRVGTTVEASGLSGGFSYYRRI